MILGRIRLLACGYAPQGTIPCTGQVISAADYPDLVGLLAPGQTSATLPSPPPPVEGLLWCIDTGGVWPTDGYQDTSDLYFDSELVTFTPMRASTYPAGELYPCDGSTYSMQTSQILAYLLGDRFGGDEMNFTTPKVSGPAEGIGYYVIASGQFPIPPQLAEGPHDTTPTTQG